MGRPSTFTPELADAICEQIASGVTLRELCAQPDTPSWTTIWRWIQAHEDFRTQYARAREDAADFHAERALEEALNVNDSEASRVAGARLRWDALRWHAGKCAPKRYGDRITQEHTGDGGGPMQHNVTVEFVRAGASVSRET